MRDDFPAPLDDRPGQPVYVLGVTTRERRQLPGVVVDLDALVPAAAEAYREEAGVDAYGRDPALFEWRTRAQIEEGRSWLWREDGEILLGQRPRRGPRRRCSCSRSGSSPGYEAWGARERGLADLCRLLLERTPSVCLFVRPENAPAIALYESVGMRRTITYRSLVFG